MTRCGESELLATLNQQRYFPFRDCNGPQINANFRLNSICNHAFVFLLFRVRIGNFHAANG